MASLTQWADGYLRALSVRYVMPPPSPISGSFELVSSLAQASTTTVQVQHDEIQPQRRYVVWADLETPIDGVFVNPSIKNGDEIFVVITNYSGASLPAGTRVIFSILRVF